MGLLSFKPRSIQELSERLKKKNHSDALIKETVEFFKKKGFLDDVKYAKLLSQSQVYSKPTGKRKLEFNLKQKGLSGEIIHETLSNLEDYDEKKMAYDLVVGRFSKMTGLSDETKKRRLYGFLKRRGFEDESIFAVLNDLIK